MFALYKKELNYYLNNPIGYIVIILFAVFSNFLFVKDLFAIGSASMRPFFGLVPWLLMIFVPAVAMRAIAEEKRTNTIETLLTLPVSETQVVLSKFLSILTIVTVGIILTIGLPISLYMLTESSYARLYLPEVIVGYLGLILLAAAFISVSIFFSSQTKNQVIAFLLSIIVLFFFIVISTDFVAGVLPKFILDFLTYFSPMVQLQSFTKGLIDLRSLFFFISLTVIFLVLTIIDLEKRD